MRRAAIVAGVVAGCAACAQLLGVEDVHDDPADAGSGADATSPLDAVAQGDAITPFDGADARVDAPLDGGVDTGPVVNARLGCTGADGGGTSIFPSVAAFPIGMAIDDRYVYVADVSGIRRCSLEGCSSGVSDIQNGVAVRALASDGQHLLYGTTVNLVMADSNGFDVRDYLGLCDWIAPHGADLFWVSGPRVAYGNDGPDAAQTTVYSEATGLPQRVAGNGRYVFFVDHDPADAGTGHLYRCELPTCAGGPVPFASVGDNGAREVSLAVNDTTIYWGDPSVDTVFACDVDGCDGGPRTVVSAPINDVYVDGTGLYWAVADPMRSLYGEVYKGLYDGGSPQVIGTNHRSAQHIVSNGACVYWTDDGFPPTHQPGQVWGVPQP